jgi:hypothetical protein
MRIQDIIREQTEYPEWFTWLQRYEQRWRVDPEYSMLQQLGLDANSTPEQVLAIRGEDVVAALRELGDRYRAFAKPARFKPQQWLRQTQLYHQLGHMQQGLRKRFKEPYPIRETRASKLKTFSNPFKRFSANKNRMKEKFSVLDDDGNIQTITNNTAQALIENPKAQEFLTRLLRFVEIRKKGSDVSNSYFMALEGVDILLKDSPNAYTLEETQLVIAALEEIFEDSVW